MTATTAERPRRRWAPRGVRTRIVVAYVALLAGALLISALVTRQILIGRLERDVDRALAQEVEELGRLAGGNDPSTGEPFGTDVAAVFATFLNRNVPADHEAFYTLVDGVAFLASHDPPFLAPDAPEVFTDWARTPAPRWGTASTPGGEARFLAVPVGGVDGAEGVFVASYFPAEDRAEIDRIVRIVGATGAVVLVVSAMLARSTAGRVLNPVRELTRTARRITGTDLSHRIPVAGHDELSELGGTFNAMLDRLDEGFKGQRQFLDDIAHELRTPITIVAGHVELLGNEATAGTPAERRETVALITDELDRMNRYVNDLLLLAKAEQHDFLRPGPVDVGEFLEQLHHRVAALAPRRWTIDAGPRPGAVAVVADEQRLTQAMLNLASNAVQHTADGGEIALGASVQSGTARLWIRDSGPGIDEQLAEQLFQRRFRGAASRARRTDGTGLGLSIVDAIARAHGGSAIAANAAQGGAIFTIAIPIDRDPDEEPPP
jgi:two-component system OmpR family sensor kinase